MPYVYILEGITRRNKKLYYVGKTENIQRRIKEHYNKKAKYTRRFKKIKLIYLETITPESEISYHQREKILKKPGEKQKILKFIDEMKQKSENNLKELIVNLKGMMLETHYLRKLVKNIQRMLQGMGLHDLVIHRVPKNLVNEIYHSLPDYYSFYIIEKFTGFKNPDKTLNEYHLIPIGMEIKESEVA